MQNAGEIATYQPTQPGCSLPNGMQTQPRLEGDVQQQGCANWQNCQKTENTRHFLREKKKKQCVLSRPILRGGGVWPTHLLNVLNALDDVIALHRLLDGISVAQDPQVLLQGLLNQASGQGGEVGQLPQHLQHLGNTLTSPQPNPEQICSSDLLALRRLSEQHGDEPFQSWSLNGPPCRSSRSDWAASASRGHFQPPSSK